MVLQVSAEHMVSIFNPVEIAESKYKEAIQSYRAADSTERLEAIDEVIDALNGVVCARINYQDRLMSLEFEKAAHLVEERIEFYMNCIRGLIKLRTDMVINIKSVQYWSPQVTENN